MMKQTLRGIAAISLVAASMGTAALGQTSSNVITTEGDWTVFGGDSPRECWAVSPPTRSVNTQGGNPVDVRRGDIRLYVAYRPGANGEVSFTGGYPFRPGSTVSVDVGGTKFDMFTEGESAWTGSADDDARLIAAMRGGSSMTVTGNSARGTQTVDTFSLMGVTAATNAARQNCQ
ncbi:MAG: invasion associated locus B family protein [Paracoccus sp. (in: a-proteobacteria)]|nr:invasion associated locus B family protein [Paracoccus sp. (in: a-proteobacteria)]